MAALRDHIDELMAAATDLAAFIDREADRGLNPETGNANARCEARDAISEFEDEIAAFCGALLTRLGERRARSSTGVLREAVAYELIPAEPAVA